MAPDNRTELSVIIVTRNTRALTEAAIRSVLESRDALRKRIIVVDNASTDDTPKTLPGEFPGVTYTRSEVNLGFARANNLGAKEDTSELLLLLNSDARLKPDSLAIAVAWMRQHPECAVAGARLLNPDGSRQNSIANFPSLATELLNKSLLRRLFPNRYLGKESRFTAPVAVDSVIGAFMLIRAGIWRQLGGLDERYFFFLEETDFCLRAQRGGWKVFHLPQVEVWHDQGGSAKQQPAAARIEYWRSRYAYFRKNLGGLSRTLLGAGLAVRLLLGWLVSLLAVLLCLGTKSSLRHRCRVQTTLLAWHLRGCPAQWGLPR
jgi:GT2 family glycosyltransferase